MTEIPFQLTVKDLDQSISGTFQRISEGLRRRKDGNFVGFGGVFMKLCQTDSPIKYL